MIQAATYIKAPTRRGKYQVRAVALADRETLLRAAWSNTNEDGSARS